MKLLICPVCNDIFSLSYAEKKCSCGKTYGRYIDKLNAVYSGGIPFCFSNQSFVEASREKMRKDKSTPERYYGERFDAWMCPIGSNTFKEEKE